VDELRKRPWVKIIDPRVFEPLEKPELFFDYIHLNTDGRKLFSPLLADTVKAALQ
jgi:lysophospholipase L1-like esterase